MSKDFVHFHHVASGLILFQTEKILQISFCLRGKIESKSHPHAALDKQNVWAHSENMSEPNNLFLKRLCRAILPHKSEAILQAQKNTETAMLSTNDRQSGST